MQRNNGAHYGGGGSSFEQARRVLHILKAFQKDIIVRKQELLDDMLEPFPSLKARSLERDLQVLKDEGFIISKKKGGQSYWELVKSNSQAVNMPNLKISKHEMLSFYALKAYLKTFQGTSVESDVRQLYEKIERFAPGDAVVEDTLYWDRSIGAYDYSMKQDLIGVLLNFVNSKTWLKLTYQRMSDSALREYEIFPQGLYSYSGSIYLIGYIPKHKTFLDFAVHNIANVEESTNQPYKTPKFDFDEYQKTKALLGSNLFT